MDVRPAVHNGVDEAHKSSKGLMFCPCRICRNQKEFLKRHTLHVHHFEKGFMDNYTLWTKHGEPGVPMEDNGEDNDDDNIPDWAHLYEADDFEDEPMHEAEEKAAEEQQPPDELGQVLVDAYRDTETLKESKKFEKMLENYRKMLYPDCKQGLKKIGHHTGNAAVEGSQWCFR